MAGPRVVLFTTKTDPQARERIGAYLPDGRLVDLQAGHMAMRGVPSPFLRDRTSFTFGAMPAAQCVDQVLAWVTSQEPPGVVVPERNAVVREPLRV
ncbi:MAG: hypothetical protein QOE90_3672 [Thermoplasmata archaeon]|jgi:hypothetical protein|nr:hypothetical protein [Thermoplasmata archaeon]